jgi:ATP-dependent helicase/nuclease subunit B
MPPVRTFLGWSRPALEQAAELLLDRYASAGVADLSTGIVVLPGARAGRRLLEVLVEQAELRHLALVPPSIVPLGNFPEKLYEPEGRFADNLTSQLAWLNALRAIDDEQIRRIVPDPPDRNDPMRWLGTAELLNRLHNELAGHGLRFADVAQKGFTATANVEIGRWQTLAAIQEAYTRRLKQLGLVDTQLARLDAIGSGKCRTESDVILIGLADLSPVVERILEQVADRVTALVYAPRTHADRFTKLGSLVTATWRDAPIKLADEQLIVVDGPADQATAAVETLAAYQGRYADDEITIGVPDPSVVPFLERRCEQFDLPSRYGEALRMKQTAPHRLLAAVADYLDGGRFTDFAALVRHPDLELWLGGDPESSDSQANNMAGTWLAALDEWYSKHLQSIVDGSPLGDDQLARQVAAVTKNVNRLCEPLRGQRSLADWAKEIASLLVTVYGRRQLDANHPRGRVLLEACDKIHDVLMQAFTVDAKLAGRWQAADAIRLLLRQIEDEPIPPMAGHSAIELLGWLELPLDDAPALVVSGFNDGFVPSFINSDPFLPNGLRRQLGLLDNDRRYARDAYALAVLIGSRRELTLIAGRRSADGDPLTPSRLAFACPRDEIAPRVLRYFGGGPALPPQPRVPQGLKAGQRKSIFEPPRPRPSTKPVTSMRVTQFRDYLACPYRYYLRHVLSLRPLNDLAEELDPLAFGSLTHDVLKAFADAPDNSRLVNAETIAGLLDSELDRLVGTRYGKQRLPAVRVQVEHLRLRLRAFARWQAEWAAQGWRIVRAEVDVEDGTAPLLVDGEPMFLRARIDRVDRRDDDGRHIIFDYKTSDAGKPPDKTHRIKAGWVDLQLPLYRHLAKAIGLDTDEVGLGYIALPKDVAAVRDQIAPWGPDDLHSADEAAARVIREIRAGNFWPPILPAPDFDDFAAICLGWQGD